MTIASAILLTAQLVAKPPAAPVSPPWDKGIQPISRESYYNAIACGKKGGANPPCVFWDTGLCKNEEFTVAMYTPYKMVAYEVWQAARNRQEPPTPSYAEAQRTRVTVGVSPAPASKRSISAVTIKRGGATMKPIAQSLEGAGGKFTFDFSAFAPSEDITLEFAGGNRTTTCRVPKAVLALFR